MRRDEVKAYEWYAWGGGKRLSTCLDRVQTTTVFRVRVLEAGPMTTVQLDESLRYPEHMRGATRRVPPVELVATWAEFDRLSHYAMARLEDRAAREAQERELRLDYTERVKALVGGDIWASGHNLRIATEELGRLVQLAERGAKPRAKPEGADE